MFVLCVLRPSPASALICPLSIVTVRLYDWENIRGKSEREGGGRLATRKEALTAPVLNVEFHQPSSDRW